MRFAFPLLTLGLCALVVASCSDAGPLPPTPALAGPPEPPAGAAPEPAAPRSATPDAQTAPDARTERPAPFDLGAIMQQVHFAFRPAEQPATWSGGHTTYLTTASEERLVMTPAVAREAPGSARGLGRPITFETTALGRGSLAPPRREGARVESDGHLALARGAAVEHLRNTEEGVAQSFRFDREPAGTGDLEVRVRVTGVDHVGASPEGHHFRDPEGGADIHYGKATWIDANGRTTPIEVRHLGAGELALIVPDAVIRASAYPADIDPVISVLLDLNQPVLGFARFDQDKPAVAFDGTNYLVIWNDSRAIDEVYSKVYGARVSPAGELLDPGGLEILGSGSNGRPCGIAFDGASYFVVLLDMYGTIRGTRVTPSGQVLDGGGGKTFGTTNNGVQDISVAYGDGAYLVAWATSTTYTADVHGQMIDTTATPVGASFIIAAAPNAADVGPRVTSDGTDFFVAWSRSGDAYGTRVSAAGTVLDPGGLLLAGGTAEQNPESVAFDGTNYLVVWVNSSPASIVGARVSPTGTLLDPGGIVIGAGTTAGSEPHAAFDGSAFVVVWQRGSSNTDLYSNRVTSAGALLDGTGVPIVTAPSVQRRPWVACGGTECLVAWEDDRGVGLDVFGARLQGGALLDAGGFHLSNAGSEQQRPSVTFGNGVYFVAWEDRRAGTDWNIYGTRVDTSGTALDPAGISISEAIRDQLTPRVAASNGGFLVTWEDDRNAQPGNTSYSEIYAARVTAGGVTLDPAGIPITSDQNDDQRPAVASDGTTYLIVWRDYTSFATDKILATRVDAAGTAMDVPPIAVASAGEYESPAVAFGGGQYLVAWGGTGARAARVSTAGAVLDPAPGIVTNAGNLPSVGFDGQSFVIAGRKYSFADQLYHTWATRVGGTGAVLDPAGILLSSVGDSGFGGGPFGRGAEVTFDGVDSIIVWPFGPKSVRSAWLSPAGQVLFTSTLLASSGGVTLAPSIASEGDGHHSLLAYAFGDPTPGVKHHRIKANVVTAKTTGEPCFIHPECKSGVCVQGVCCNTACDSGTNECKACSVAAGAVADGTCTLLTGTACDDGNACTQSDLCASGTCTSGAPVACQALDDCHVPGACQPATGQCTNPAKMNGAPCDDGDPCTQSDLCQAGSCTGTSPLSCAPPDTCHEPGECEPSTGSCTYVAKPNGAVCDDGNACTLGDTCQDGGCAAGGPSSCAPPDACHEAGACDPATGQCSHAPKPNGTACDDEDACTQTDACQSGACVGANPVACPAPDDCTEAGVCDPATGQCSFSPKPDGAACDDGDACTEGDACQMGSCSTGAPVTCPAPPACHEIESCDPATGACSYAEQPDETGCDDDDACTRSDTCQGGTCVGSDAVQCEAQDECHLAGACDAATGECSNPQKADGAPCAGGVCKSGVCTDDGAGGGHGGAGGEGGSGNGGAGGAGGSESGGAGGANAGGAPSSGGADGGTDGGCGCSAAAPDRPYGAAVMALAIGALRMRRRRRAGAPRP